MKKHLMLFGMLLAAACAVAQTKIIKIDSESGSFKNFAELPANEPFILEGTIEESVVMVEVSVSESKSKKEAQVYAWNRSSGNTSEGYEVIITGYLKPGSTYDFDVTYFKSYDLAAKQKMKNLLQLRVEHYLTDQIKIGKKSIEIEKPKETVDGLNQILIEGIKLQRSRNGIGFDGLSEMVANEIQSMNEYSIKNLLRKKKNAEIDKITKDALAEKVAYLTELVMSEVQPFFNSDLVQQYRKYEISEVPSASEPFTLPINGGLYVWNATSKVDNVSFSNTSLTPGFGLTLPFRRSLYIKGKSVSSLGLSLGVLTSPVVNTNGDEMVTPTINLPMYAAVGFKAMNFIRFNAGVLVVSEKGNTNINNLRFVPTVGATLEFDLWLGIKK